MPAGALLSPSILWGSGLLPPSTIPRPQARPARPRRTGASIPAGFHMPLLFREKAISRPSVADHERVVTTRHCRHPEGNWSSVIARPAPEMIRSITINVNPIVWNQTLLHFHLKEDAMFDKRLRPRQPASFMSPPLATDVSGSRRCQRP